MKPLIGITSSIDATDSGAQKEFLNDSYVQAVERAGGLPVIIPNTADPALQIEIVKRVDGVIISGGPDMDPRRYGARVSAKVSRIYPRRDAAEFSLIKYVIDETELPVLGICRGIQSINAVMGGDLIVDLPEEGYLIHGMANIYPRTEEAHDVRIDKDSKLFGILGKEELGVNSYHHQAVRRIAPGFRATAYSIPDGVIEAMEIPGDRFVVGVQWHPEEMIRHEEQQEIFRELVKEAAKAMHR